MIQKQRWIYFLVSRFPEVIFSGIKPMTQSESEIISRNRTLPLPPPRGDCTDPWYCDIHTYKERHLVERFSNKLKVFRRVATRYDKLAVSFAAFILLASICILLK